MITSLDVIIFYIQIHIILFSNLLNINIKNTKNKIKVTNKRVF